MTEAEKALEATWIHERTNAIIPLEHLQTIHKALQAQEIWNIRIPHPQQDVQGLVAALTMIKAISSVNVKSAYDNQTAMHKLCSIREQAETALKSYQEGGL